MKEIIAVVLKEEARIPIIGCAMLNNTALVESICYIDEDEPFIIREINPVDFTTLISTSIREEQSIDFVGFAIDSSTNKINSSIVKALRSYKGIVLFKKSYQSCFLIKKNKYYYFWHKNSYYILYQKAENLEFKKDELNESGDIGFELNPDIYNILTDSNLELYIYDLIIGLSQVYNYSIEDSISFALDIFNYNAKSLNVKMHKNKVKQLLGLDAKGDVNRKVSDNTVMIESRDVELENYMDGVVNMEELKSSFKPRKNIKETLEETPAKVIGELEMESSLTESVVLKQSEEGNLEKIMNKDIIEEVHNSIQENLEQQEYEGDPHCSLCHGKGFIKDTTFGLKIKCECVDRYKELKSSKENSVHGMIKVQGKGLLTQCMELGLIPRRRVNDLLGFREMGDRIGAICKENGESINLQDYEIYKTAMKNVLASLVANKDLDYSILFSAPNGFSKTTFVYSCLKLLLLNGKNVVPFVSLFELAQKRLDYMTDTTWRKGDNFLTDTEKKLMANASYGNRLKYDKKMKVSEENEEDVVEEKEEKKFIDMTDSEKDIYIQTIKNKSYTYKDYLDSDLLFCQLSVAEQSYIEISTLKSIMDYRGLHCKPTIIITDRNIEAYKSSIGMATDVYLITDMLTKEEKYATYDRALLVAVKKDRKSKLKVKIGESV